MEKTGPLFVNYGFYGLSGAVSARRNICEALGLDFKRLTLGEQVHSVNVAVIKEENIGAGAENPETRIPETDALVTSEKNAPIAICTADCVPILLADTVTGAIGAAHAGWRGTLDGIVEKTIGTMRKEFGTSGEDINAFIGPSIGPCCFEVGAELIDRLDEKEKSHLTDREGGKYLDLRALNADKLTDAGVKKENIEIYDVCTCCNTGLFFSHRGDLEKKGSNISIIVRT